MKPNEFFYALMTSRGDNPSSLSKVLARGNSKRARNLQPRLFRFMHGSEPETDLTIALAEHFKVPMRAFHDDKAAADAAKGLSLQAVPIPPPKSRAKRSAAGDRVDDFVSRYEAMSQEERAAAMARIGGSAVGTGTSGKPPKAA